MAESRFIAIFSADTAATIKLARSLSPRVSLHSSGAVLFTVPPHYEREALDQLLELNATTGNFHYAVAASPAAALLAARYHPDISIPDGREQAFLAGFPVQALSFYREELLETLETLDRWGIRTLGQLDRLPEIELASRLGAKGLELKKLARGEESEPLQLYRDAPRFQGSQELEWELDGLEPLTFVLRSILEHICTDLFDRALAAESLEVIFRLSDGSTYRRMVPLAFPMRNPKILLSLLMLKLQTDPPRAPIKRVFLQALPTQPQVVQGSLLEPKAARTEDLSRTVARLSALAGEKNLGIPVPEDTHRPDAFQIRPFQGRLPQQLEPAWRPHLRGCNTALILKRLRPPQPTRLRTDQILACSGPWKTSGEWWAPGSDSPDPPPQTWQREEWDIEMLDGRICRIFWDCREKSWFVDGVYD